VLVAEVDDRRCSVEQRSEVDRTGDHDDGSDATRHDVVEGVAGHRGAVERCEQLVRRAAEPRARASGEEDGYDEHNGHVR
jgi:hypothetical protein